MSLKSFSPVLAVIAVLACGNGAPPPAAAPSTAASDAPASSDSQSAADSSAAPKTRGDLETEAAKIDASLNDLAKRLQSAQEATKAELQHQLAILQKREADLKTQLQSFGAQDAGTDTAGGDLHRALGQLRGDMKKLEKQIAP